ncbi:unnamed protein product, partial [Adineta steineri]
MSEKKSLLIKSCLEDLSAELLMSIFDYLTSIEISGYRLTQFHLNNTNYLTYKLFHKNILPNLKSTITSLELGSDYYYGQIDYFHQYQLLRLDSLKLHFIDPKNITEILEKFLNYNRLQWFDKINLIMDEEIIGWNEQIPFCVQNIPVRELKIT